MPESHPVPCGWRALAMLALLLASGCARKAYEPSSAYASYDDVPRSESIAMSRERPMKAEKSYGAPPPPPPPPAAPGAPVMQGSEGYYLEEAPPEPEPDDSGPARMIHYDGYAQIRTPRAEELVEKAIALAEASGGEVETRSLVRVTLRVPVERFDEVWAKVLELGPVVRRNLGAEDVTDAFTDLDLRLQSMRATRDRLNVLLAKATVLEERLQLLKEIHRLTEQIEVMEAQLRTLADLAAMSRITIEAVAPDLHANATRALPYGMERLDQLAAFDHGMVYAGRPVKLAVPEGFVALDPPRYHAQAADGAVAWAFRLDNDPQGSPGFWRAAVVDRIGEQLADGATTEVGGWSLVRFVEPGAKEPYVWHLGFRVDGKHLEVLQITYPDEAQERRYHQALLAVLKGGEA